MTRIAAAVSGRRSKWIVLVAWIGLVVAFAPLAGRLTEKTDDRFLKLIPDDSQAAEVSRTLQERFPEGETTTALLVYRRPGGLTDADRARMARDARAAAAVPLAFPPLAPVGSANPDGFGAPRGDVAFMVVPLRAAAQEEITESIEALRERAAGDAGGLTVHVTGGAALESDLNTAIESADATLLIATGVLVLVLLMVIYRSPVIALLPLVVVAFAYQVAAGLVFLLAEAGMQVTNTARSLLLVLMFGAGTDYCLLLVARYVEDLRSTEDHHAAMARALPRAAPAIIASGLTVIAALLVLLVAELRVNQTFGPTNAVGIAVGLLASITLLPALLAIVGRRGFWPGQRRIAYRSPMESHGPGARPTEGVWSRLGRGVLRRPVPALLGVVALLAVGTTGLTQYQEENNILSAFRDDTDSTRGFAALRSGFPPGALAPNLVLVERTDGPLRQADVAAAVRQVRSVEGVSTVSSVLTRSADLRIAAFAVAFPDDPYANPALERVEELRTALGELPSGVRAIVGDGSAIQLDYREAAERDLRVVVPLVLVLILLILCALLRALVAPLYLIGSVILSFLAILGTCVVLFELLLDEAAVSPTFPTLAFIFLVALGVDYNIFLMDRVREEARRHGTRQGMLLGLVATGPVITSAGIILAGTFAVLATLPITILVELGIAVALGVLVDTFLVRTIMVPAIAALVGDLSWWPSRLSRAEAATVAVAPRPQVPTGRSVER